MLPAYKIRAPRFASIRLGRIISFALCLLLPWAAGCSTGIIVHDEARAAALIVDFLSSLKSAEGTRLSYAWTDDRYKEEVSFSEFRRVVSSIRKQNQGADIRLLGYEIFGPVETIVVHASSKAGTGNLYFKFVLVGTKSKDYYLLNLETRNSEFSKKGIYRNYGQAIVVKGV
jgi:hypothetical protein